MKRLFASICSLAAVGAAIIPAAAPASGPASATGKIGYLSSSTVTIQTGGRLMGVLNAMTSAANTLNSHHFPYVWGGGHAQAGIANVGMRGGPGFNGRRKGYDCSGSVAAVLAAAGLWPAGSPVPNDAGVIRQLLRERLIAPGAGTGPREVTLYDHPGIHIFMNINGRFFGTGANGQGGPGWLDHGTSDASDRSFKRYHVLPAVLRDRTSYGHQLTFVADPRLLLGAELADQVTVNYAQGPSGTMLASALSYAGATTSTGVITAVGPSSLTLSTAGGQSLTLSTSLVPYLVSDAEVGDTIQATFSRDSSGQLVPHAFQIVSGPSAPSG